MIRAALAHLVQARHRAVASMLATLRRQQWDAPEAVRAERDRRLRAVVRHARTRVPYWRAHPGPDDDLAWFAALPALEKTTIKEHFAALTSEDAATRGAFTTSSGGSTGAPTRVMQDAAHVQAAGALRALFDEWSGRRIGDDRGIVWGAERDLLHGGPPLRMRTGRWLRRERWLNAFRMEDAAARDFLAWVRRVRPGQLLGYATSLHELALFAERHGIDARGARAVLTSAAPLHPHMREAITRVFGAPVFDRFGSREVGDCACECEAHDGLHVVETTHLVEVVRPDGTPCEPGETGDMLVTSLVNHAMPLFKYRIGDRAVWHDRPCPCGRGWRRLARIEGRTIESLTATDGSMVSPMFVIHLLGVTLEKGWIRRFQFAEHAPGDVTLRIVPVDGVDGAEARHGAAVAEATAKLRRALGDDAAIAVRFVDEIPLAPSGKYLYVVREPRIAASAHG